jgi:hypothetical protein
MSDLNPTSPSASQPQPAPTPETPNPTPATPPPPPTPIRPPSFYCRHLHASGLRCGSPALRHEEFCYFHHTSRRRAPDPRTHPRELPYGHSPKDATLDFTLLPEDRASLLLTYHQVILALGANRIDTKRAALIIQALQGINAVLPKPPRQSTAGRSHADPSYTESLGDAAAAPAADPNTQPLEDIVDDPDHGLLAPVAPVISDDEAHKSLLQKFIDYCDNPPNQCPRCLEADKIAYNKREAKRLLDERAAGVDPETQVWHDFPGPQPTP